MVRRHVAFASVFALVLALALPAVAGEAGKTVKLTGYITDEWCGAANASAEGKGCAEACAKKGATLVLHSDGKLYKLSDQEAAMKNLGVEVVVTGTLEGDDTVKVTSIEEASKKA
jgi:hypothetical protein